MIVWIAFVAGVAIGYNVAFYLVWRHQQKSVRGKP